MLVSSCSLSNMSVIYSEKKKKKKGYTALLGPEKDLDCSLENLL